MRNCNIPKYARIRSSKKKKKKEKKKNVNSLPTNFKDFKVLHIDKNQILTFSK